MTSKEVGEFFSLWCYFRPFSFRDRFCDSRKGRTGEGEWFHLQGEDSMTMSG